MSTNTRKSTARPAPNVTPIRPPSDDDSRAMAASYIRQAMGDLLIYEAALKTSECEIAQIVSQRLGLEGMRNDLDVARELLEKGDQASRSES